LNENLDNFKNSGKIEDSTNPKNFCEESLYKNAHPFATKKIFKGLGAL